MVAGLTPFFSSLDGPLSLSLLTSLLLLLLFAPPLPPSQRYLKV